MKKLKIIIVLAAATFLFACNSGNDQNNSGDTSSYEDALNTVKSANQGHQVTVLEAIDVDAYTYIRVSEGDQEYWAAISARKVNVGQVLYYNDAMEVDNFTSKNLDKTFKSILFIQEISDQPIKHTTEEVDLTKHEKKAITRDSNISIDIPEGAISIEELFKNKSQYEGKEVMLKGVVVKLNKAIMQKNWIHIQDGTSHEDSFDLTFTTTDPVNFSVGETLTVKGTVYLNKDFGSGYFYDLIVEEAQVMN